MSTGAKHGPTYGSVEELAEELGISRSSAYLINKSCPMKLDRGSKEMLTCKTCPVNRHDIIGILSGARRMKRQPQDLHELSQAVRELRAALGLTQQEFANRLGTAIRTIARWENNQPPHGRALVQLAQVAQSKRLQPVADKFVQVLQRELASHTAAAEPELKGWLDGLQIAFQYRFRCKELWQGIAQGIIAAVEHAIRDKQEVSHKADVEESRDLYQQLRELYAENYQDLKK